ncbi:MAG: plasma-membrane proton-efflux P-type ATPase [Euryarchaeota archaeon]|jgi:H+-transporting ATPase|nr:plasma-membrane proton-efflux P-type ATPase [Euryarchaeota archaeon]
MSQKILLDREKIQNSSTDELLNILSSTRGGLTSKEALRRQEIYGPNQIMEEKVSPIFTFLKYFWGPIPWMIEIAIVISAFIGHYADLGIITVLLFLNGVVGFWQEYKANNAIELLKEKLAVNARVLRDGKWTEMAAQDLVPGDIVHIRLGNVVPADLKLIKGDFLSIDESALTGESLPVERKSSDVAYSGSVIIQGEMEALVILTGMNTYFGKTAQLVEEAETKSHLKKAVVKIGNYLILVAAMLVAMIFMVALFRKESLLSTLQFALVLVVASIPVALPAVLSVTMAIGAIALAKKEAIVSKLSSIEEMAGVDVLCSDKTGTITKNELAVAGLEPFPGFDEKQLLLYAALASEEESGDPIDGAILKKTRTEIGPVGDEYNIKEFKPFNPVVKRTEALVEGGGKRFGVSKGAVQSIQSLALEDPAVQVEETVDKFAKKGYRSLGVGKRDSGGGWSYVGIIALYDPPREDSAFTIKTAQAMGVEVKMVTGDHLAIAQEVSGEVNLGTEIVLPEDFIEESDRKAKKIVEESDGFAQVFPEHKYHIVELLQDAGHIVGMTGDGVNDAPALKKADVGIAVSGSTDAAKSAAAIVLTKPGLSVIVDSIKESRKIFQRMNNYSIYRIAETIRVLFFISSSIMVFNFYPVTALMIVLLALLNDAPIMTIAYDNVIYSKQPEKWDMRMILSVATILGFVGVLSSFLILYIGVDIFHLSREVLQSFIYLKLSVAGHLMVFVARTKGPFWSVKPALPLFLAIILTQLTATLITVYGILLPAMGWYLAIFVWIYAVIAFVITDFIKVLMYRLFNHEGITF